MEIYSHVSAAQQREAVEVLQRALAESHFESHLGPNSGGQDWAKAAETGQFERESGSGGRIRTYDQAVNSRLAAIYLDALIQDPKNSQRESYRWPLLQSSLHRPATRSGSPFPHLLNDGSARAPLAAG
jgi:hypothetical protein